MKLKFNLNQLLRQCFCDCDALISSANNYQAIEDLARRRAQEMRSTEEEVRRVEEEKIQVLNNMEELEQKIKELDNQMEESAREVKREARDGDTSYDASVIQMAK